MISKHLHTGLKNKTLAVPASEGLRVTVAIKNSISAKYNSFALSLAILVGKKMYLQSTQVTREQYFQE